MGCCKSSSGAANSTTPSNNPLATDPNLPKAPDGTVLGQDGSRGGTVPYYSSPGGASPTAMNTGGPYVASGSQNATGTNYTPAVNPSVVQGRGALSSKYESNGNPASVTTDSNGHKSYGEYQINTGTGTMNNFMEYEKVNNPSAYNNLVAAGGGSATGQDSAAFGSAWQAEAANDPNFANDQTGFIQSTHYDVAAANIQNATGINVNNRSMAVQQAVWSTAVQNGPNSSIFTNAFAGKDTSNMSDADIINSIYDERGKTNSSGNLAYFSSSSKSVQNSVANRFTTERQQALAELS